MTGTVLRAIEVDVLCVALKARRLRLFSPHAKKMDNMLEYEDQEIVNILTPIHAGA